MAIAQDASALKDNELLPVKLEAKDKSELDSLAAQIAALQQRIDAKKDELRSKYKANDWSACRNGMCLAGCVADLHYDLEWRGDWLIITKRVGINPCGSPTRISNAAVIPSVSIAGVSVSSAVAGCAEIRDGVAHPIPCPEKK